ncbi:MAG TPA: DUF3180 domain-containing protein [Mycobacteriales bacterium]|nr:DUF3180 domain-containing protein [Mycobacteriales bacterium]
MRPTRLVDLLISAVVAALATWLLVRRFYGDLPPLPYTAALTTFLLAVAELFLAPSVTARLAGKPRTKPILPMVVARLAALAKASSQLAALAFGAWVGTGVHLLRNTDLRQARADLVVAGLSAGAAVLLGVAALRLERACRIPDPSDRPDRLDPTALA